jgi:hypothetical protein
LTIKYKRFIIFIKVNNSSSREVEGKGPMKPGNLGSVFPNGANSLQNSGR